MSSRVLAPGTGTGTGTGTGLDAGKEACVGTGTGSGSGGATAAAAPRADGAAPASAVGRFRNHEKGLNLEKGFRMLRADATLCSKVGTGGFWRWHWNGVSEQS